MLKTMDWIYETMKNNNVTVAQLSNEIIFLQS